MFNISGFTSVVLIFMGTLWFIFAYGEKNKTTSNRMANAAIVLYALAAILAGLA